MVNSTLSPTDASPSNEKPSLPYFFGRPSSLDAVLVSELTILNCAILPNKYLSDPKLQLANDRKWQSLLDYTEAFMVRYLPAIHKKLNAAKYKKLLPKVLTLEDVQSNLTSSKSTLSKDEEKKDTNGENNEKNWWAGVDEDKKRSIIFVVVSISAFFLYWKWVRPAKSGHKFQTVGVANDFSL